MTTNPFWIDSAPIKRFPALQRNINVDALVVGAGITGITAAYLLKKAGLTVALIERERVASIDTGHTTAHLTFVTDVGLHQLAGNFGDDPAQAAWDAGAAAIDEIERIVQEEEIQCEFTRAPGYLPACLNTFSEEEISSLKKEARLATKLGFGATYLERVPYFSVPGVRFPNQAKFQPRKYLRALVMKLSGNGSHVFEKSAVTEFDAEKRIRDFRIACSHLESLHSHDAVSVICKGVKGGYTHRATDELGYRAVEDVVDVHDLHATMLHLLGLDHKRLTYFHNGRRYRLTDVAGEVIEKILS